MIEVLFTFDADFDYREELYLAEESEIKTIEYIKSLYGGINVYYGDELITYRRKQEEYKNRVRPPLTPIQKATMGLIRDKFMENVFKPSHIPEGTITWKGTRK